MSPSIIIPTHNRCGLLRTLLISLDSQVEGTPPFEVIVVVDGCVDDTMAMLCAFKSTFALTIVERPGEGPAHARNAGVQAASGDLLLFLDDDVIPTAGFVKAHVDAHLSQPGCVGIGPYPPAPHASSDLFRLSLRRWWLEHFAALAEPGHRFSFRDLLTGNLSMSHWLWDEIGGLDPQFARAREDLELGVRLLKYGARFTFIAQALALHHEHETMDVAGSFRRAREEGRSDVHMALKHPELGQTLKIVWALRLSSHSRRDLFLLRYGHFFDVPARVVAALLGFVDRLGLGQVYLDTTGALKGYWYLRGAAQAMGGNYALLSQTEFTPQPQALVIDLANGLVAAETQLDAERPAFVRLIVGELDVGTLPYAAGAEPWQGRHLRQALSSSLAANYLRAIFPAELTVYDGSAPELVERLLWSSWRNLRVFRVPALLNEAYSQWSGAQIGKVKS